MVISIARADRPVRVLVLALLLVALLNPVGAHVGDIVYPVYEIPAGLLPDLHDETLEDWEDVIPSVLTHEDFTPEYSYVADADDLAFRLFLGWSALEQRIYVAAERLDDQRLPGGDFFRIAIDGDHSGGDYGYEIGATPSEDAELDRLLRSQVQVYTVAEPTDERAPLRVTPREAAWLGEEPYGDIGLFVYGDTPASWLAEMAITPFDEFDLTDGSRGTRTTLSAGQIIGIHASMIDGDTVSPDGSIRFEQVMNLPESSFYETTISAGFFTDVELVPCTQVGCSGSRTESSVQVDSWGLVKASLMGQARP